MMGKVEKRAFGAHYRGRGSMFHVKHFGLAGAVRISHRRARKGGVLEGKYGHLPVFKPRCFT